MPYRRWDRSTIRSELMASSAMAMEPLTTFDGTGGSVTTLAQGLRIGQAAVLIICANQIHHGLVAVIPTARSASLMFPQHGTDAMGSDASNQVSGLFGDSSGIRLHPWGERAGDTTIDVPGNSGPWRSGINDAGVAAVITD